MTATTELTRDRAGPDDHLFAVWFPIIGPLAAWAIHLCGEAALVRIAQQHHWVVWCMHGLTVATGLVALAGLLVAVRATRPSPDEDPGSREDMPTGSGRRSFLGWVGLYSSGFNLLLILAEELIIVSVDLHA